MSFDYHLAVVENCLEKWLRTQKLIKNRNKSDFNKNTGLNGYYDSQDSRGGGAFSLTTLYHFHPLHRHLDIGRAITADSLPPHIAQVANNKISDR